MICAIKGDKQMADYVTKLRTEDGDKQIDYLALANLPIIDATLSKQGALADAKAVGDSIQNINKEMTNVVQNELKNVNAELEKLVGHTHDVVTSSSDGLMSADDKNKLDLIEDGANKYILPTADKSTIGGVTTTSEVESSVGFTACPIISGVPYYKDATLSSMGVTITSTELNNLSNIREEVATKPQRSTITLTTSGWNKSTKQQTVDVSNVTANNIVFVSANTSASNYNVCSNSHIRCVSQTAGKLTFECIVIPSVNVTMNIVTID
jgi:hypothetical protein